MKTIWLWMAAFGSSLLLLSAAAQPAYFVDGYHGGVYGHYPESFTKFIVDSLRKNPAWRISLEIEPETWDVAQTNTPQDYSDFKALLDDPSAPRRIEYVNPAYGQGYLWNISGESIIRQFDDGLRKLRQHFPRLEFSTYASEEPCFTSALPGILKSFGFAHAVLKNPNTCWGGYTRAFGGELVDWIGPDGTHLATVPRYETETLVVGKTWETIAAHNSSNYIKTAQQYGIAHPVGMCLQDAGWRFGPWLTRDGRLCYQPTEYVTWRDYFESRAIQKPSAEWSFSQEDVQVSLVWGAQVLQRIAQQVRGAENRIVMAEKLAAMAEIYQGAAWPEKRLDEAWRTLLLAQHHDCWIVPYNGRRGDTWADKVQRWTGATRQISDDILQQAAGTFAKRSAMHNQLEARVFNTLAFARTEPASVLLPADWGEAEARVVDHQGKPVLSQMAHASEAGPRELLFQAQVPAFGFVSYRIERMAPAGTREVSAAIQADGKCRLESDLYRIVLDPKSGGVVESLVAKGIENRQVVDQASPRRFNELRGYFFQEGKFCSTADQPAAFRVLESGPLRARVEIRGQIASNAVTQIITLVEGQPRIDFHLSIAWQGSSRVGASFEQAGGFAAEHDQKAFYDDRFKLLALFPLNLANRKVFKDAPFDVTESRLTNTFFSTWSGIKNNVILHWVDVVDAASRSGLALLSDHTTSYAHGPDHPLGLTVQYCGVGLWGRNYSILGPTEVNYALVPHPGAWEAGKVYAENARWNEPLVTVVEAGSEPTIEPGKSLVQVQGEGWDFPAAGCENGNLWLRMFNPSTLASRKEIAYDGHATKMELIKLNGETLERLVIKTNRLGKSVVEVSLPRFGVGTLKISR